MEKHHADSIHNLVSEFQQDPGIQALLLGGSIAHGFARPDSDIDVTIVIDSAAFAERRRGGLLHYNNRTLCTYDGYIDGKYVDVDFLRTVAERGSDPARYAFDGAQILFSRIDGLDRLLAEIMRYPVDQKRERIERFAAQLLAWRWYYSEGQRQQNPYIIMLAVQKLVLFGSRIVLAENELFFPYHKWMLRVLRTAKKQPPGLIAAIDDLLAHHTWEKVQAYCLEILTFVGLDPAATDKTWPTRFMRDTELRWVTQDPCIDDL